MKFRNFLNFALCVMIIYLFVFVVPFAYDVFVGISMTIVGMKLAEWLMESTRKYVLHKTVCPKNKAILITGCDSGFGNALVKRMDKLGFKVYAGCLIPEGDGAKELTNNCSTNVNIVPLDVTSDKSVQNARDFIAKDLDNNVLWTVVNNAGIGHSSELDWTSFEEVQRVYEVNCAGVFRISKTFMPFLKKSKGRLVNNTSICGRFTCPGYVGYCMAKSAAVAMTTGFRIELAKWGVEAISIEPWFYSTPLTGPTATWKLTDRTWDTASKEVRDEYGEEYLANYKKRTERLLYRYCNPNIDEVIDCFEDAILAEEPLSTYFPSSFWDKVGIKLLLLLPSSVREGYQRNQLDGKVKPVALMENNNKG